MTNSRYLFGYTNLLALDIAPLALSYHIFGHIKFTYLLRKVTWPSINVIHKLSMSITQTSCIEFNAKFSNCYTSVIS